MWCEIEVKFLFFPARGCPVSDLIGPRKPGLTCYECGEWEVELGSQLSCLFFLVLESSVDLCRLDREWVAVSLPKTQSCPPQASSQHWKRTKTPKDVKIHRNTHQKPWKKGLGPKSRSPALGIESGEKAKNLALLKNQFPVGEDLLSQLIYDQSRLSQWFQRTLSDSLRVGGAVWPIWN